jgi:hypothetical protein
VPWRVLRGARDRGTVVAVVLDRVPPAVRDDVTADFGRLLSEQGLPGAPLFVVEESTLDATGLLPGDRIAPVAAYLTEVATDAVRRRGVTRRTLLGAVAAASATADDLARATVEQVHAAGTLAQTAHDAYQRALSTVAGQIRQGAVLRGGAYACWRASVAAGELHRAVRAVRDPSRVRPLPAPPGRALLAAIAGALEGLLVEADTLATDEVLKRWRDDRAGRPLVDAEPSRSAGRALVARDLVRDWQEWVRTQARLGAPRVRTRTRGTATAATVLLATLAAVAPPVDGVTAMDSLRQVLANRAVVQFGEQARAELLARVADFVGVAAQRWRERLEALAVDPNLVARLSEASAQVGVARQLALATGRAA